MPASVRPRPLCAGPSAYVPPLALSSAFVPGEPGAKNRREPTEPINGAQTLPPPRRCPITESVAPVAERGTPSEDKHMKIHEYQAKELLARAGAAIPRGVVASS